MEADSRGDRPALGAEERKFYVYEHWRPDTGACFYVGKGYGRRAHKLHRRGHHRNICDKLRSGGLNVDVRIISSRLTETEAFALEIARIAFWRGQGCSLVNRTDGGEGASGRRLSEASRRKVGDAHAGKIVSSETRSKLSAAHAGVPYAPGRASWSKGKPASSERKSKTSTALMGRPKTTEHRANISAALAGRVITPDHRAKIGAANAGRASPLKGTTLSPEHVEKLRQAQFKIWERRRATIESE